MSIYNQVMNNMDALKLDRMKDVLSDYLDSIKKDGITPLEVLKYLTDVELDFKQARASRMRVNIANFPFEKRLSDFDFNYQPSINKSEILDLATLRFIEKNENVLLIGSSGVGKTHLAVSLGVEAALKKYGVYFISCHDLIAQLSLAHKENRIETRLKHFAKYRLLIIDEIGYLPVDKNGANLLFQLIAKRYERNSTIVTSNQSFSKWGEVFSDTILANAILDRLIHHSTVINITGKSYRIKNHIEKEEKN